MRVAACFLVVALLGAWWVKSREVLPDVPDARYDPESIKTGYEVSLTRHFNNPQPMRALEEIRTYVLALEKEDEGLLGLIIGGDMGGSERQALL